LISGVLWVLACIRFRAVTGREANSPDKVLQPQTESSALPSSWEVIVSCASTLLPGSEWPGVRPSRIAAKLGRALVVLAPLGLLVMFYLHHDEVARMRLEQAIARVDQHDPGWRFEELEAKRAVIPDAENSALRVLAILKLPGQTDHDGFSEAMKAVSELPPERQLTAEQTAALAAELKRSEPALTLARSLVNLPRGRFPMKYGKHGVPDNTRAYESYNIVELLGRDALLRAQRGDADGAIASCRALINAGRAIGDEPILGAQLARGNIHSLAARRVERVLAQGQPSAPALESLQAIVEDEARYPVLLTAWRAMRAGDDSVLEAAQSGDSFAEFLGYRELSDVALPFSGYSLRAERARVLEQNGDLVAAAKLPDGARYTQFVQLASTPAKSFVRAWAWFAAQIPARQHECQAELRSLLVALAVERYRQTHGHWPASMSALAPDLLTASPTDPFDGKPLRYRRLADGVVIYSVGPDGKDNGGNLDRGYRAAAGKDVGVRLWDVNKRRQPPSTGGRSSDAEKSADH
jgi:hypothetical protein